MKRKVIRIAGKTSVISLPREWVKKYGIEKGDELEVTDRGRELVISTDKNTDVSRAEVDIKDMDEQTLKWTLSALHKYGYDEIKILYDDIEDLKILQEMIKNILMSFVVMQQTSKKVVIRAVSKDSESEFEMTLRRAFLVTISLGESILEKIKNNEKGFGDLIVLEKTNNQLTNFCERILNKKGYSDFRKTCFYYVIIWNLEKVCDDYRDLCSVLEENDLDEDFYVLLDKTNEVFREYYDLFYSFSSKKLVELDKLILELISNIDNLDIMNSEIYYLKSILVRIREFMASTIAVNH